MTYTTYKKNAVRNFTIFKYWREGMTYEEIGKKYHLHKETIRQIILGQCRRYDCIKNPPEEPEPSANVKNANAIQDLFSEQNHLTSRIQHYLILHFGELLYDKNWNPYKAIVEMTDDEFLSLRNLGWKCLPIFHEVRDEARRRLEDSGNEVDASN
jgi:hypothetical protein